MAFKQLLKKSVVKAEGYSFWRKITVTSSHVVTATKLAITSAATGDLAISNVIMKTDATGLAGGTNFVLGSTNSKGVVNIAVETTANLGANATRSFGNQAHGDVTTSSGTYTVTQLITVLEAGQNLWVQSTGSNCTGAGTIDIYVQFERISESNDISMVGSAV